MGTTNTYPVRIRFKGYEHLGAFVELPDPENACCPECAFAGNTADALDICSKVIGDRCCDADTYYVRVGK